MLVYTHSVILVIKAIWLVRYLGLLNNIHLLESGIMSELGVFRIFFELLKADRILVVTFLR